MLPSRLSDRTSALLRFEREAKAVAALAHPNILSIFDYGNDTGVVFAVMELLEGETLSEKLHSPIDRKPSLGVPIRKAIDYGVQVARGLAAAHDRGIIQPIPPFLPLDRFLNRCSTSSSGLGAWFLVRPKFSSSVRPRCSVRHRQGRTKDSVDQEWTKNEGRRTRDSCLHRTRNCSRVSDQRRRPLRAS